MAGRDREPGGEQWIDGGVLAGATDRSVAGVRYGDAAAIAAGVGVRIGVWTGSSDADLSGGGPDGHAQGVRGALRSGARPIAMRAAERACIFVLQRAAQPGEVVVLGRQRIMGMCEKIRARAFSLAGGGRRAEQTTAESRGLALLLGGIDLRETQRRRWYRKELAEEPVA